MNFALPQHRTDRHPVGLVVVVGLHVALAAVLLSAKLHTPPAPPPVIDMKPIDEPVKKPEVKLDDRLPPPKQEPLKIQVPIPIVDNLQPDPIRAERVTDDKPVADPPQVIASAKVLERHEAPHFTARHTVLNAGAIQCRPDYPAAAQRAGVEGVSRIRFTVDALGKVIGAQILQSSGATREHRLMDKAAAEALAQCPVTMGIDEQGRPVGGTADVEYHWTLN